MKRTLVPAIDLAKEQAELSGLESRRTALAQQAGDYRRQLITPRKPTKPASPNRWTSRKSRTLVAIAESPVEPHLPSKPNVKLNLALGGLLACFLSLAWLLRPSTSATPSSSPASWNI